MNDKALTQRLKQAWTAKLDPAVLDTTYILDGMGAEDFPFFITEPHIPSLYFLVGSTPKAALDAAAAGGAPVPTHHSALFKVEAEPAVRTGVEATVIALMTLLKKGG